VCRPDRAFPLVEACCAAEPLVFDEALFDGAMAENLRFQAERQPYLRALWERGGLDPSRLDGPGGWRAAPPVFVGVMKEETFLSVPESEVALTLESSGTGGQRTRLRLDRGSLDRLERMGRAVFAAAGFVSERPARYLLFSYDREEAASAGTSWSSAQKMGCAPVASSDWLIRRDPSGAFAFDEEAAARILIERAAEGPVRFLGFPAFMHRAVEEAMRLKPDLRVDPDSFVLAGGGWKNHAGTPMTHESFAARMEEKIGLPRENVRDVFGMAEHGIPYPACRFGHHHVPSYARLAAVDPLSGEDLGYGREGLLLLSTPYLTSQPNQRLLSTDAAVLERDCPCGLPGDYIASVRRGGTRKHKGCAMAAQEILDRMKRGREEESR
jgi:hypothetical protein